LAPRHFVVPYLSKRKTTYYQEDVKSESVNRVSVDMSNLAAKLSRVATPGFPNHESYREACEAILGFMVSAIPSQNGQRPGVYLPDRQAIPIEQMGEGVPNIVGLLADLALSEGKLILIEEPENDIHPQALKALLDLIIESSKSNQFVVSTHSNIVVRHLAAAENSRLYNVTSDLGKLPPIATIRSVEPTIEARLEVLRELGYTFSDFDLWDGWLILEESSAERIIRDYLIPWFAPKLSRVRTLAVNGVNQIKPTFDDFHRLVRFTHLEEAYRDAAWVRVDGDRIGSEIIAQLKNSYSSWKPDRFGCFSKAQFEQYYPVEFTEQIKGALAHADKKVRREAKRKLLDNVRAWLDEDELRGQKALEQSAAEIITDLKLIESQLAK
jgi:AAA domain, putative AbiEii toxin, Type IV TA system